MLVLGLNHVNIRTLDMPGTIRFYTELLGFHYRHEDGIGGFSRNWLRDEAGRPIIHLRELAPAGEGAVDHVALDGAGRREIIARLEARGIDYSTFENPLAGTRVVLVRDPNGVLLELNFAPDEDEPA